MITRIQSKHGNSYLFEVLLYLFRILGNAAITSLTSPIQCRRQRQRKCPFTDPFGIWKISFFPPESLAVKLVQMNRQIMNANAKIFRSKGIQNTISALSVLFSILSIVLGPLPAFNPPVMSFNRKSGREARARNQFL